MASETLADVLADVESPASYLRNTDFDRHTYDFPDEYTHWIEEQRAVRETAAIVDQSYHMGNLTIEGPDALELLAWLSVNNYDSIRDGEPPQARNIIVCNHDGYVIGDNILFYLDENTFTCVGGPWVNNWIRYNAEVSDLDVETEIRYRPFWADDPADFRFQIQGPNALDVIEEVTDGPLPDIPFFKMDTIEINGVETYALGHGMAATPGLEIFGPYEAHDEILGNILDAGEEYGLRRLGSKAYKTGKIGSGWFVMPLPAIYESEEMAGYREWLDADEMEASLTIGGSFESDDITDYYITPFDRDQGNLIDFEKDFVGKAALERLRETDERRKVTLVWDDEDVVDCFASLFREGEPHKFIDLPDTASTWSHTHYDKILKDGDVVGLSKYPGYLYYKREMLSLATIDAEYAEPGTEVSFVWGDDSGTSQVERHSMKEIGATVAPAPYVRGGRRDM
ncbi:MAG: aminomethyl transferase family protein [Halobacteriaceae archaeon]